MQNTSFARSNVPTAALFCLLCGLAATTARPGPDYSAYRDWANALVRADLEEIASSQRSPLGHKLTQWLAGPAVPYALPQAVALDRLGVDTSMVVMGSIAALAGATLLAGLLKQFSGDRATTIFWFAAAWVASPIGYYLLAFSSETLAIWMVVLLVGVLFAAEARPHPLVVGLATSMLLMTRPYWALYAVPTLASVIRRDLAGRSPRRFALGILAIGLPIVAAVAQLAIVNRWMTGDWWRFAYLFGDADFKSLDPAHPQWGAVLWHPMRGLLVYHPAVGLGFFAMLALVFRAPTSGERVAWGALAAIVVINAYVQACWFCWWQGTGITLGMRGLVPAAVPAVAALARIVQLVSSPVVRGAVVVVTTVAGLWSWLMLPPGPTDYVSYTALFEGLRIEFDKMLDPRFIFLAMPGTFLFCLLVAHFTSLADQKRTSIVSGCCAAALVTLWAVYAWTQIMLRPDFFGWLNPKRDPFLSAVSPARQMAIALAVAAAAGLGAALWARFSFDGRQLAKRTTAIVVSAGLVLFAVAAWRIENGPIRIPERPPTYPGKLYYVPEIQACWDDYQTIPEFNEPKSRLREFMIREGIPLDVRNLPTQEQTGNPAARPGDPSLRQEN